MKKKKEASFKVIDSINTKTTNDIVRLLRHSRIGHEMKRVIIKPDKEKGGTRFMVEWIKKKPISLFNMDNILIKDLEWLLEALKDLIKICETKK